MKVLINSQLSMVVPVKCVNGFHLTIHRTYDNLSMFGLKSVHISKCGPWLKKRNAHFEFAWTSPGARLKPSGRFPPQFRNKLKSHWNYHCYDWRSIEIETSGLIITHSKKQICNFINYNIWLISDNSIILAVTWYGWINSTRSIWC